VGDEKNYFFAGVVRSKSVRNPDDGIGKQLVHPIPTTFAILFHFPNRLWHNHVPFTGPQTDEFFTLSIGGMVTMLNNSGSPIHPVSFCQSLCTAYL
jgi:hypothetical protein